MSERIIQGGDSGSEQLPDKPVEQLWLSIARVEDKIHTFAESHHMDEVIRAHSVNQQDNSPVIRELRFIQTGPGNYIPQITFSSVVEEDGRQVRYDMRFIQDEEDEACMVSESSKDPPGSAHVMRARVILESMVDHMHDIEDSVLNGAPGLDYEID